MTKITSMKRHILQKLQDWKHSKNRKPLILKGVRQCGKTYSLKEFGKSNFRRAFIINFEKQESAHQIFEGDLSTTQILSDLEFYFNNTIDTEQDLLILDEIQNCPRAITSLKYFCEDLPSLAVCAAGSLLGLELTPESFPVGKVDFLSLYPMSFTEFLEALGDSRSVKLLSQININQLEKTISPTAHQHLWERFKWYCITGGLPEVVKLFIEQSSSLFTAFKLAREKQDSLIKGYYADIAKHSGKQNAMHIERVFRAVPTQLAKTQNSQAPRFQFSNIIPGVDRYQRLVGAIDWLSKAGLIIQTPIIDHVELPLKASSKESLFKLYCFDTGILGAMNQLAPKAILNFDFGTYKGYFAENFVAQHLLLAQAQQDFFCWQKDRHEIEFIKTFENKIIPIEVKAGHITRAKSLDKYNELYQPELSIVLSSRMPENDRTLNRAFLPLYAAQLFSRTAK